MYFFASKIIWAVVQPSSLIAICFAAALLLLRWRPHVARNLALTGAVLYLLLGVLPFGNWLIIPLETWAKRPPQPEAKELAGIIVLGGAIDTITSKARGTPELNDAAERMSETVRLAAVYPELPVIFSGGSGEIIYSDTSEASVAEQYFGGFGLTAPRLQLEGRSRNTAENAAFTANLLKPTPDRKWLLVTSAFHMARARALFEGRGFQVVAWPVDYRTRGKADRWRVFPQPAEGLRRADLGVKEWLSMIASWIKGDIRWPKRDGGRQYVRQ